mmetsp:Transcript_49813/g.164929  ORF Transcript_49813/g.164929 Transcript_49813/m.164929 type:complete len:352 (-) Transcript_49813:93-1148(-)
MSSLPPLPVRALRWRASPHPSPSSYSVMCWNMLAQCYTRSEYFPSVSPKSALKWKHRGPAIVAEVQRLAPDVIALQEVDNWDFMSSELGSAGYDGVRKGKTGGKKDGVAVLWKRALLRLAESEEVETDIKGGVGLLVRLEPASAASDGGGSFVVATTHLFWNPQLEVLKLRQAELCLRRAAAFARGGPLVFCGDLNSMPGSDVLALCEGGVAVRHTFTPMREGDDEESGACEPEAAPPAVETFEPPLRLHSAYEPPPAYTTLTDTFRGCLDHILLTRHWRCLATLDMIDEADILAEKSLPSSRFPSDHMPVLAVLSLGGADAGERATNEDDEWSDRSYKSYDSAQDDRPWH